MFVFVQMPATRLPDTPRPTFMLVVDKYDPTFKLDPPPPVQSHHTLHCSGRKDGRRTGESNANMKHTHKHTPVSSAPK